MSPHEMTKYRAEFDAACARFDWQKREVEVPHERDSTPPSEKTAWFNDDGVFLFYEGDISGGLVEELVRQAKYLS